MPDEYSFDAADEFLAGLSTLSDDEIRDLMAFLWEHVRRSPRMTIPDISAALHGEWTGLYAYRVSETAWLLYSVSEETATVRLEWLGVYPVSVLAQAALPHDVGSSHIERLVTPLAPQQ